VTYIHAFRRHLVQISVELSSLLNAILHTSVCPSNQCQDFNISLKNLKLLTVHNFDAVFKQFTNAIKSLVLSEIQQNFACSLFRVTSHERLEQQQDFLKAVVAIIQYGR
jgi:hypothetical protein